MTNLDENAWRNPENYRGVYTTKEAREIILQHQGRILACGWTWEIVVSKPVVGTVEITLRKPKTADAKGPAR